MVWVMSFALSRPVSSLVQKELSSVVSKHTLNVGGPVAFDLDVGSRLWNLPHDREGP